MKRRCIRKITIDRRGVQAVYPILAAEKDAVLGVQDALDTSLSIPGVSLSAFGAALAMVSLLLALAHLLFGFEVWPFSAAVAATYLVASALKRKPLSGWITFITVVACTMAGIVPVGA